jgi:hypothetical protein
MNWPVDVLDRPPAEIAERQGHLVAYMLIDPVGHDDRARLGQRLQSGGDIDGVAEHILVGCDDVAQVKTDPKRLTSRLRHCGIPFGHSTLQVDCASNGFDGAAVFNEYPVANSLDDAAMMAAHDRRDQLREMGAQITEGLVLVGAHHAAVSGDVGKQDRREPPVGARIGHSSMLAQGATRN